MKKNSLATPDLRAELPAYLNCSKICCPKFPVISLFLTSNPPLNRTKSMDPPFFPFRYGT